MDEEFYKNHIPKGDPRYVYNKEMEFKPNRPNEWDDD